MDRYCLLDGEIVPLKDAEVSVLDIGLLRRYGIYDGKICKMLDLSVS